MFKKSEAEKDIAWIEEKLSNGTIKKYIKGRQLGKGGFAKCFEVTSVETDKKYAAKVIEKATLDKEKARQKLASQIKIHKALNHQYIVGFQHFFEDVEFVYILLQKCQNQTLNELLKRRKRLTDIETKYYIYQLITALKYLHEEKIIHRDLKLGNLFLSDKLQIKIGDFGLATKLNHSHERRKTKCGTPNYIAPQILDDKKTHSFEVDIWSMGVITYTLLVGKPPFETNDVKITYEKIKACQYEFPENCKLTQCSKTFIGKMLQLDPSKRATIDQLLNDPFLCEESIPSSLHLATLACPPNAQFLQKYRNAEVNQIKQNKFQGKSQQRHKLSKNKSMRSHKHTVEKAMSSRVFSAANLLSNNKPKISKQQKELMGRSQRVWVSYWSENPRYGLGYLFNSNATGFRYNDSTCMISNKKMTNFRYIEFDFTHKIYREDVAKIYDKETVKVQEEKKFKIFTHFDKDLRRIKTEDEGTMSKDKKLMVEGLRYKETQESALDVYVRRYHRTNKLIVFWFNNKAIQAIFEDETEILLNKEGVFTYVNKLGNRHYFDDKDKQKQGDEFKKRYNHLLGLLDRIKVNRDKHKENKSLSRWDSSEKLDKFQTLKQSSSRKLTIRKDFSNCK